MAPSRAASTSSRMPSFNGRRPDSMMLKQDGHFSASKLITARIALWLIAMVPPRQRCRLRPVVVARPSPRAAPLFSLFRRAPSGTVRRGQRLAEGDPTVFRASLISSTLGESGPIFGLTIIVYFVLALLLGSGV